MTNKEIKKILRARAERAEICHRPDEVTARVKCRPRAESSTYRRKKMPAWLYPMTAAIVAACLIILMIPLGVFNPRTEGDKLGGWDDGSLAVTKSEEIFSLEMLALGNALTAQSTATAQAPFKSMPIYISTYSDKNPEENLKKIAEDVNDYLMMGDALLWREHISIKHTVNFEEKYGYDSKLSIAVNDNSAYTAVYTAYYSLTEQQSGEARIEGVFVTSGGSFPLTGEREREGDEVEMTLRIQASERAVIEVCHEKEAGENEYEYRYYEDGKPVKGVSIEAECEGGVNSTEIEITEDGVTVGYEFTYYERTIECEYESGEHEIDITIFIHDSYYLYVFDNGVQVRLDKK